MKHTQRTAYERLKQLLTQAEAANYSWMDSGKFTEWNRDVQAALRRMFGDDANHLKTFNDIQYSPMIFTTASPDSLWHDRFMSGMSEARAVIRSAIREFEDYNLTTRKAAARAPGGTMRRPGAKRGGKVTRKIFVVHGHDNEMKEAVARFLEKLDFQPVILHEQPDAGDTVIEKLERHSDVGYAIVLLSPDDIGGSKSEPNNLQSRARQNVILELGYFLGNLGRRHVCPLVRGKLDLPSDYHGVVYVQFEGESWKLHLVKELKDLGYRVNANKAFR